MEQQFSIMDRSPEAVAERKARNRDMGFRAALCANDAARLKLEKLREQLRDPAADCRHIGDQVGAVVLDLKRGSEQADLIWRRAE